MTGKKTATAKRGIATSSSSRKKIADLLFRSWSLFREIAKCPSSTNKQKKKQLKHRFSKPRKQQQQPSSTESSPSSSPPQQTKHYRILARKPEQQQLVDTLFDAFANDVRAWPDVDDHDFIATEPFPLVREASEELRAWTPAAIAY